LLVEDLTMRYQGTPAVDQLSLTVATGTITAVLGPNGAGKTTTLETAVGLRRPQQGRVRALGLDPVRQRRQLLPRIGVMPQTGGAWSGVRAAEMLRYTAALYAHPLDVDALIDRLGLGSTGRTPYRRLSGGQQQRLGLAMAMVGRPELLFVDEPTAGMDPQARHTTWTLLDELRRDGVTVVLTTHLIDEAERLADHVYVIDNGRVIAAGSPAELVATHGVRATQTTTGRAGESSTCPETLLLHTSRPVPPEALATALVAADCRDVQVQTDGAGRLRLIGPITPSVVTAAATCCQRFDAVIDEMDRGSGAADAHGRQPARTLEDVFLDLTGRRIR
jgi:ABC-2 type transport system ATP-binding protein